MRTHWKQGLIKITIWLMSEIALNALGMDTLAAYSEFMGNHKITQSSYWLYASITTIAHSHC